jgi:acyl-CoA reductase-like NAD-dependent aldehyde dehydrogenase
VGDPSRDDVLVGPVATKKQQTDVLAGIERFVAAGAKVVVGGGLPSDPLGVEKGRGFFVAPTLLECASLSAVPLVHQHEVFGPCTTLLPYDGT